MHTDNKNSSFGSKNEDSCRFLKSIRKQQEKGYSTRKDKPEVMGDHRTGSTLTDYSAGPWHPSRVLITESIDSPRQDEVVNWVQCPVRNSREKGQRKQVKPATV